MGMFNDTNEKRAAGGPPNYRLTCRHCGNQYVQMQDLLFHRCSGDGGGRTPPPRTRKAATRGPRARTKKGGQ
jgi:hypothetical protein